MGILKIGLTGGIASGKSEVSSRFAFRNIQIIDADQIARDLFKAKSPWLTNLREKFGDEIFDPNGELIRKKLGSIVFGSPEKLAWLNQFTHPKVAAEITVQLSKTTSPYVILDIPLLVNVDGDIPSHLKPFIDRVLVVDVSEETQISRLTTRDGINRQSALKIMQNQSTRQQKLKWANDVIDNNGSFDKLESQVELLHNQYMKMIQN